MKSAVRALEAGADVLLMPPNPEVAIKAVLAAVKEGRHQRETDSMKVRCVCCPRKLASASIRTSWSIWNRSVKLSIRPKPREQAQLAADRAVTLVKNENARARSEPAEACIWVLAESRYGQQGTPL